MAQYHGLVPVNIISYDDFKNEVLGNWYDVDGVFGAQCVDAAKLLAGNAGRPSPYWKSDPDGYAEEGWTVLSNREYNAGDLFDLVYNRADVRRGDLIVIGESVISYTGHVAFADTDWNGSTYSANLLGQNQVNPNYTTGHEFTVTTLNVTNFLGAFRFRAWQQPTPPSIHKTKFPWFLIANKLRNHPKL